MLMWSLGPRTGGGTTAGSQEELSFDYTALHLYPERTLKEDVIE